MADLTSKYRNKELRDISMQACINAIDYAYHSFPENYIKGKFTDFLDIQGGTQPSKSKFIHSFENGYVRFLQIRDFASENTVTYIPLDKKNKLCNSDDILLGRYGASVGKILTGKAGAYNVACAKAIILNEKEIEKNYLFYLLHSSIIQNNIRNISRSAQGGFNKGDLAKIELVIPKIYYQKKLIKLLNSIDYFLVEHIPFVFDKNEDEFITFLIQAFQKHLNVTKEIENFINHLSKQQTYLQLLRQTILQEAIQGKLTKQDPTDEPATELLKRIKAEKEKLIKDGKLKKEKELPLITEDEIPFELPEGWIWCKLIKVILKSEAGKSLICDRRPADRNEWGIIKVSAMSWGEFDERENKVLPMAIKPIIKYKISEGDYLISRANTEDLIGKSVIVGKLQSNLLLSDKSIRIIFSDFVNKHYINFYNNSSFAREYYIKAASGTSDSMKNITREQMYQLPLPLPPLSEQQRIVAKVQQLQQQLTQLEVQVQQSRQYAKQLLQSVLKEAFKQKETIVDTKQEINSSPNKLHGMLLAKIIDVHYKHPECLPTLGRVKGEKTCHIIEDQLHIDLGRKPVKDAAGPVDFFHLLDVEREAQNADWFEAKQKTAKGKVDYIKGKYFNNALKEASNTLKEKEEPVDRIINLFLFLDTEQTEIITTVYAAWSNLLIRQTKFVDNNIVTEARDNWTKEKLRYSQTKYQQALEWLRKNELIPTGKGKLVNSK